MKHGIRFLVVRKSRRAVIGANCYAESLTKRYAGRPGWPAEFLPWTPENAGENVVLRPDKLDLPLHWRKPKRIFANSMSDLFHEDVPDEFIDSVFAVMAWADRHTFQVLTKRPDRMRAYLGDPETERRITHTMCNVCMKTDGMLCGFGNDDCRLVDPDWPLPNVQLGVSVENQRWADIRIPLLLQTPARVRFISAEPLLGPVDLRSYTWTKEQGAMRPRLDWVICGGESGPGRREMDLDWARSLRDQCRAAGVPFFFKQKSGPKPGMPSGDPTLDECKEMPTA